MKSAKRVVVPEIPHHITQRGVRRVTVFWEPGDFERYLELPGEGSKRFGLRIWAYCLMPNHVHLIARPEIAESMSRALQWIHAQYARAVNRRLEWTGHLWQQRDYSAPMDWQQVPWAMRYVLRNPVRAGLVERTVAHRSRAFRVGPSAAGVLARLPILLLTESRVRRTL